MSDSKAPPVVFSTRTLNEESANKIRNAGIVLEQRDFIKVFYEFEDKNFLQSLNNPESQARIFTSKNAVISLQKLSERHPLELSPKKTFTVGIKTTEMLSEFGVSAAARANNAISLAQIIARNKEVQAVDFFCGDKSLNDLPEYLQSKGIKVNKEIVYHTELVHEKVDTADIEAVIFLSPTAVFSFFKKNKLSPDVPAFCIGATTSDAVHLRCENPRIESDEPSIESVADKVVEYFSEY